MAGQQRLEDRQSVAVLLESGSDATNCAVEIQVKRHSRYKINVGNSLIIHCPVRYCEKKPVMQWCKIETATCVQLKEGKAEWKANTFTLEVFSVHQNDSGLYRCRAIAENFSSESHGIEVIVEEKSATIITISPENTTSISEGSQESGNPKILHIIYASASVGLCCPFIVVCMFWSLRRYHAKQKRTALTQQRQKSLVRSPAAAPSHTAGTAPASEESSSLYYCSMASPLQALHGNTIYDNNVPPWNAPRTAPNAPRDDPVTPSVPVLLESPDGLTYAALNHSASAERCQRRELTVENEFTEYASINVK
ncbi:CGG triplet repeat-binding protein 1 isoform X2 [Mycteria americana]|uniref:CGG triplet repeat-binding protein 1 isoform X2 n=1 Tax=Mycteria americana TaxID=33587 RepID=UPI003F58E174